MMAWSDEALEASRALARNGNVSFDVALRWILMLSAGALLALFFALVFLTCRADAAQSTSASPGRTPHELPLGAARSLAAPSVWSGVPAAGPLVSTGGSITGTVTQAAGGAPIEKASICTRIEIGDDSYGKCTTSGSNGEYEISGLASGSYTVEFSPGYLCIGCGQENYITRYYDEEASLAEAEAVPVTAGSTTSGIDARMAQGGEITGTVIDGYGYGIENLEVCALRSPGAARENCAATNSSTSSTS